MSISEICFVPLNGPCFLVSSCALLFFVVIYAFEKSATFLVFTDWLCTREDLHQSPWLENLWASKPFMRICPLWTCVCNFSMRYVCWFLSQDLVVLLSHVFLSYYMFLAATKHWILLFFVHPRDTKYVSLMSTLRQVKQKSLQRLEHWETMSLTFSPNHCELCQY